MIGLGWHQQPDWAGFEAIAPSLGLFAGASADCEQAGHFLFAQLNGPRAKPRPHWKAARSPAGWPVLLEGWIDNAAELAASLDLDPGCGAAVLLGAAVERWGAGADSRIIGTYAAIVVLPGEELRLSRSPWASRPLFYHASDTQILVCSIVRPLFAAGLPKRLRPEALDALLRMELPDEEQSLFEGIDLVPQGAVVTLRGGERTVERWYDPLAIPELRLPRGEDYVEAASDLLARSVAGALSRARRPGIALSGGLDSALVCAEALRQLPAGERLASFTFHPLDTWDGKLAPRNFGDDRPWVQAFAAMHPALEPHFTDNRGVDFDDRMRAMFVACDAGYPARVSGSVYHGVYAAAQAQGCDWLLIADAGNLSFSSDAPWAMEEFARAGNWRALRALAACNRFDPRPVWQRVAIAAVMARLPAKWRDRLRAMAHPGRARDRFANPFLLGNERRGPGIVNTNELLSREQAIRSNYRAAGLGNEMTHSFEQVFGIRQCDAAAYRPLIEFCFGIPTEQFNGEGQNRWLARRMALGRLPKAQRLNPQYGRHNVDWHARLTPRLPELRGQVEALSRHPELSLRIDTQAMLEALDNWPAATPSDPDQQDRLQFYLPATLYIAQFVDYISGRNEA
jgi:asparagine synthase (glutamine-hydrolysing)